MSRKIYKPWETDKEAVHSPAGVEQLRESITYGLTKKYIGIAESMWQYTGWEDEKLQDMQIMSLDTVPEKFMMNNGQCVIFEDKDTKQVHMLPFCYNGGINMYGNFVEWSPIPVGYNDTTDPGKNSTLDRIRKLQLSAKDSVIMRNDLFGGNDSSYIQSMVKELVDNNLTLNQLQLLAKSPFVFNTSLENQLSAQNFFLALSQDKPVVFTNSLGESVIPQTEATKSSIDPALFDLLDRWEANILEYIGFPCVPITKRAQQSVSEIGSNDEKITVKRIEKFNQRCKALDRANAMFGINLVCHSVIDEMMNAMDTSDNDQDDIQDGNDEADDDVEDGVVE